MGKHKVGTALAYDYEEKKLSIARNLLRGTDKVLGELTKPPHH